MKGLSLLLLLAIGAYSQHCVGRCGDDDIKRTCQCDDQCASEGNCCEDYDYRCGDCVWEKPRDFPAIPPLLFDRFDQMILPTRATKDDPRIVRVENGAKLTIACSGNYIAKFGQDVDAIQGTCVGGNLISTNGAVYSLKRLGCYKDVSSVVTENNEPCGNGAGRPYSSYLFIGFNNSIWGTYEMIGLCFDQQAETTLYTKHFLRGANIEAKEIAPHPPFQELPTYFDVTMANVYTPLSQLDLVIELLQSVDLGEETIVPREGRYLAKGQLAPDADFVLAAEQSATYYYINAVPQWQFFNNGNWKCLENATRDLAKDLQSELTIYTGTYGVLELNDIYRNPVQIYLGLSEGKSVVPAPAIMWKVVYEEISNQACLVIGVNSPFPVVQELHHFLEYLRSKCYEDCSRFPWLNHCPFHVRTLGESFCCPVNAFGSMIPNIPNLGDVQDLVG